MALEKPVVAVYRKTWTGWDLTFIQNQVASLSRWKPFRMVRERPHPDHRVPMDYQIPVPTIWDKGLSRFIPVHRHLKAFRRILTSRDVKVLHVHFGTDAFSLYPYTRWAGLPLVVTFHGYDVTRDVDGDSELAVRNRTRLHAVFQQASLLLAVSTFIAQRLRALGAPEHKIRIHYMGIPHQNQPEPNPTKKDVIFVGRFVEKKGVDDLIRAYSRLSAATRARHSLRLVGSGPMEGELRLLAQSLGVVPEWLGWRSPEEVYDLVGRAAVFCGPSKRAVHGDSEGLGMVFLEAQSQGTPVVATRSGGIPDAVLDGETGILVEEGNVGQLADALENLLQDPDRIVSMGLAGARFVREKFDLVRQTGVLEQLYDEVVR